MMDAYEETALSLLKRARVHPFFSGVKLFELEVPAGLRTGEVIELYGASGVGKSELLLQVISSCILPRQWNDFTIGGHESGLLYFDNDYHFCMIRLVSILESRIKNTLASSSPPKTMPANDIQQLILSSLTRFHLFRCKDSLQFIVTLHSLPTLLESEHNVKVLIIDSISSYYWLHKHEDRAGALHQQQICSLIKKLTSDHNLIVFGTKWVLFAKQMDGDGFPSHKEYLHSWNSLVKYRVLLTPSNDADAPLMAKISPSSSNKVYKYSILESGICFV